MAGPVYEESNNRRLVMNLVDPPAPPKFRREHATSKSIPRGAVDGRSCQPDTMSDSADVPMEEPKNSGGDLPVTVTDQGRY
jgi:hypothetical protein